MLKIFQKYLLYRKLEFMYSLADVLMISIGRNTDDKIINFYRKFLVIFYYFGTQIHVGILCRIPYNPYNPYFSELYMPPFF